MAHCPKITAWSLRGIDRRCPITGYDGGPGCEEYLRRLLTTPHSRMTMRATATKFTEYSNVFMMNFEEEDSVQMPTNTSRTPSTYATPVTHFRSENKFRPSITETTRCSRGYKRRLVHNICVTLKKLDILGRRKLLNNSAASSPQLLDPVPNIKALR